MRRFFAPPDMIASNLVTIDAQETRHLRDVLRLQTGGDVSVFDGQGREYLCRIQTIGKNGSELEILESSIPAAPESPFAITLASTVLNGEKYDLIVQKAVELGVQRLIPMHTVRCDVKAKDAVKRVERWRRIAMEATKQSGRATIMEISEPISFVDVLSNETPDSSVLFSERDGKGLSTIQAEGKVTALVGPKGGWDDGELESARSKGIPVVTLGGRVLRAETAAISICTILQHRFGDLN